MPFDFQAYDQKCAALTAEELQREWQHYTRLITGAATSTTVSGLALPLTLGVSSVGIAMAAPAIHNARKKREIIERHLQRHDARHVTRKRDVLGGAAVSGTIGVVTLGIGTMGADAVAQQGAEHGINAITANETAIKVVTHAAMDGVGMGVEHLHTDRVRKREARKAFEKAGVFQAVDDAKAQEAGYAYNNTTPNQQQAPYGLQPQYSNASSSRLSVISAPPPYSPGQEHSVTTQQATQYQPTAMNVPAYYSEGYQQYATFDAKVDTYMMQQPWTSNEWTNQHQTPTDAVIQAANPENVFLKQPMVSTGAVTPGSVASHAAVNAELGDRTEKDMDDLIADIEQQLVVTETSPSIQSNSVASLSYQAGPIAAYYELEANEDSAQSQMCQHSELSMDPQPGLIESADGKQMCQEVHDLPMTPDQPVTFAQPNTSLCPGPSTQIESPPAESISHLQTSGLGKQTFVPPEKLPITPQATDSLFYPQNNQADTHIVQPLPTQGIRPVADRYVPSPFTAPSPVSTPQGFSQQPSQLPVSPMHTPTTTTQSYYDHCHHHHQQQQHSSQPTTYFPPPPSAAAAPLSQPSRPVMSKRRSIMTAVALKASQTLSQHRAPSAANYSQTQHLPPTPQSEGQAHNQQVAQQYQTQQQWSHSQYYGYQNPQNPVSQYSVGEPVYAPVPLPKAYSTHPQAPITPISPPQLPAVQYPQHQQQQGYFP